MKGNDMTRKHVEKEMREADVPRFKTKQELMDYIDGLCGGEHDYGTCVYAMSMAAVAAYYYVSGQLGVTGFQASCADLDILRRTRRMEVFSIVNYDDLLYPQYEHDFSKEISQNVADYIKEQAAKNLVETPDAHKNVVAHWKKLAAGEIPFGLSVAKEEPKQ